MHSILMPFTFHPIFPRSDFGSNPGPSCLRVVVFVSLWFEWIEG